mmetsp:Transcript_59395/g.173770  ORF Transcript_59395/g.173770 Transcript_59395/m.173770 type:complete len:237 (-) Transcript_59395:304-1014(-)
MRFRHVLVLEVHYGHGERGRVHQDLPVGRQEFEKVLDDGLELRTQELVRLIHDDHLAGLEVADALVREVQHAAGGRHHDVHLVVEPHDVLPEARAPGGDHALHVHVLPQLLHHGGRLQRELARGHEYQALDDVLGGRALLEQRDDEGAGLAGAVLGARQHGLPRQGDRDAILLDRRGLLVALLEDPHEELALEVVVLEVVALRRRHVLRLHAVVHGRPRDLGLPVVVRTYMLRWLV